MERKVGIIEKSEACVCVMKEVNENKQDKLQVNNKKEQNSRENNMQLSLSGWTRK